MSDYKQTRDAAGKITSQYDKMLRSLDDDLVKRLDQALHFEDWMPVPENFSEAVPLLRESRNRIEELSNCVAVLEAKLDQQDDLVQAAVAAALTEAAKEAKTYFIAAKLREAADIAMRYHADALEWAKKVRGLEDHIGETDAFKVAQDILALITPDAQAALDRVVATERERCAKVAESVALPMDGKIAKAQAGYMRGIIAHHIREGGE